MNVRDRRSLPLMGVDEALAAVLDACIRLPEETIPLGQAGGRYLAREIRSTADMPPFDRTAMDGFAVRAADVAGVPVDLQVVEEIPAGHDPRQSVGEGQASRIMTGAMIPGGADAVVMVEHTEELDGGGRVRILRSSPAGRHIRKTGEDLEAGALLLSPGDRVGAAAAALLAGEGQVQVQVTGTPSVALLSTGDELVEPGRALSGSRIRETNSWSLARLLASQGIVPEVLGIARDEAGDIREKLERGLRADVLLVSGGVSMGEYDLVGTVLKEKGTRAVFERVAIQPGKPLFFGIHEQAGCRVFGLPGNPVSSIVDFLVFARPALEKMLGNPHPAPDLPTARLAGPVKRRPGRRGYLPASLGRDGQGRLEATPVPSMGSADLVALSRADAFLIAPESRDSIEAGERVQVLPIPDRP